ncbi:MAG: ATP synthase F1 subunit delta [Candidatus Moranbacteria bacterium CG_4_8_14_3_um_filter_34_16]|nr:MAG: ATP synthase F1 subunit delta [Candidatus Moranbacteria bacterium CG08_land_8_20_14_0_20_34_16]PIW94954.1 MAG: ATP synthase F1 subunit delta [Candidatus Moranbacteria bacterium CG_4_8_14_3_um_filter_34_16]
MKISSLQYAKSLYESVQEKTPEEAGEIVSGLVKILFKKNQLRLKNEIIQKFEAIYNRENKIIKGEIITREKLADETKSKLENYIKNKYEANEVFLKEEIDEKIKGGIILKVGDDWIDFSVAKQLKNLKQAITK